MPKTKISEFSATPANNTDIDSINIAEGCAPSGINDAIRELMAQLKDFQTGAVGDSFNGPVGTTTAAAGAFTTLSSTGNTTLGDASGDSVTINGTATFANANPTLSAGTANGVAYLNGSKVVTSGSALTFDGTTFAQTGANGIPIRIQELASVPTSQTAAYIGVSTSAFPGSNNGDLILAPRTSGGNLIKFYTGNGTSAERYSIDSVGVAIWSVSGSEQMRLTSTGLGIGTSSPAFKLDVNGDAGITASESYLYFYSNYSIGNNSRVRMRAVGAGGGSGYGGDLRISTRASNNSWNTDAMTLDASGNLLVGTTSTSSTSGTGLKITTGSSQADSLSIVTGATSNAGLTTYQLYSTGASAYRFYVGAGGTIYATSTTITAISDQRLKENIRDLDEGLATVMALKPRKFDWKSGKGADIKNARGFIAQEFETVLPDMIETWKDPAPEGEEPYKAINANLIPTLVKAIQELKAEFDAYKASHP